MADYFEYDWRMKELQQELGIGKSNKRLTENDRKRALDALRHLTEASLNLALRDKSRCQDDNFLRRFLWARKHDVQESFNLLIQYYSFRQAHPELFAPMDQEVSRAIYDGLPGVLAERDRRGRTVLVMFAANWCPAASSLLSVFRAMILTLEKLLEDVQNMANGIVIVVDWSEFTFKQSCSLQARLLKLMIECFQDCMPLRFKGIHFIGQPWYVETALAVIKPFLRAKTRERINLHGNNLSTLHNYLPLDILPAELGGEAPSYNPDRLLEMLSPLKIDIKILSEDKSDKDEICPKVKLNKGYISTDNKVHSNGNRCDHQTAKSELLEHRDD